MGCTQSVSEKPRRRSRASKGNKVPKTSTSNNNSPKRGEEDRSGSDDYAVAGSCQPLGVEEGTDTITAPTYDPHTLSNRRPFSEDDLEKTKRLEEQYEEQQRVLALRDANREDGVVGNDSIDRMCLHTPHDVPQTPHEHESPSEEENESGWNVEDIFAATTRGNHVLMRGGMLPDTPTSLTTDFAVAPRLKLGGLDASNSTNGGASSSRKQNTIRIYHKDLAALLEGFDLVRYGEGSVSSNDSNATPTRKMRATFSQGSDNLQAMRPQDEVLCDIDIDPQSPHNRGEITLRVHAVRPAVPNSRALSPRGYVFDAPNGLACSSGGLTEQQLKTLATGFRQHAPSATPPRWKCGSDLPPPLLHSASVCTQPPEAGEMPAQDPPGIDASVFIPALDRISVDTSALPSIVEPDVEDPTWDLLQSIPNAVDTLNNGDILFKFRACGCSDLTLEDRKELATFVNLSQFQDEAKENCCPPIDAFNEASLEGLTLIMVRMLSIYPHVSSKECNVDVITSVDYQKSLVVGKETFEKVNRARTFRKNKTVIPLVYSFIMQMTGSERADHVYNRRFADVHSGMVPDRAVILERTKRNMAATDSTVKSKSVNLYYDVPMPDGRKCTMMSHTSVILKSSMPAILTKMLKSIGKTTGEEGRKQLLQSRKFLRDRVQSGWELMEGDAAAS